MEGKTPVPLQFEHSFSVKKIKVVQQCHVFLENCFCFDKIKIHRVIKMVIVNCVDVVFLDQTPEGMLGFHMSSSNPNLLSVEVDHGSSVTSSETCSNDHERLYENFCVQAKTGKKPFHLKVHSPMNDRCSVFTVSEWIFLQWWCLRSVHVMQNKAACSVANPVVP